VRQYELLEHIGVHRWFLGTQRGERVGWDEAVASWFDDVYTPWWDVRGRLADFPGRTEADLYLWLIEHRWFLEQSGALHSAAPLEDVVREYAAAYSPRLWRRLARLIS
jgi:hypothetical protein